MMVSEKELKRIVRALAAKFPSFCGGKFSHTYPMGSSPMFLTEVDVEKVVRFVLASTKAKKKRARSSSRPF